MSKKNERNDSVNKPPDKPIRTLVSPGTSREENRQAAIDMHRAISGREPTADELADLDKAISDESGNP